MSYQFNIDYMKIYSDDCFFLENEGISQKVHEAFQEANSVILAQKKEIERLRGVLRSVANFDHTPHNIIGYLMKHGV